MYSILNKVLKFNDKLVVSKDYTIIELEVSGTSFPDRATGATIQFDIDGTGNEIYFDWGDGTPIETFYPPFNKVNQILHYYQDLADSSKIGTVDANYNQRRIIKIRFNKPQNVGGVNMSGFNAFGKFPESLGYYDLKYRFQIINLRYFESFPTALKGIRTGVLLLDNLSQLPVAVLPEWIYNSRITNLRLRSGFALTGIPSTTNTNKLINIVGLSSLEIHNTVENTVAPNWKDIPNLVNVNVGNSLFETLPVNISTISQLKTLTISPNANFRNWGNGIGLLTELTSLSYSLATTNLLPTSIPLGAENCWKLKTILTDGSYNSVERTDAHITAWYNCATTYGDITATANNKFRGVSFGSGGAAGFSKRPSGTYQQPIGYEQGSSNGTPASAMEMCWVLTKQYGWKITVADVAGFGSELLT